MNKRLIYKHCDEAVSGLIQVGYLQKHVLEEGLNKEVSLLLFSYLECLFSKKQTLNRLIPVFQKAVPDKICFEVWYLYGKCSLLEVSSSKWSFSQNEKKGLFLINKISNVFFSLFVYWGLLPRRRGRQWLKIIPIVSYCM